MLTRYAQQKINKLNKSKAKIQVQIKHTLGKPINLKDKKTKKTTTSRLVSVKWCEIHKEWFIKISRSQWELN